MNDDRVLPLRKGRPRKYATEEEAKAARKAADHLRKATKVKNITVDADLSDKLNEVSDRLVPTLGFRPTMSQTIRWLIHTCKI